jgi:hypothetical protein
MLLTKEHHEYLEARRKITEYETEHPLIIRLIKRRASKMDTEFCECGHVDKLLEIGFLKTGTSIQPETGKTASVVVLWQLKDGKDGRLSVKNNYIQVQCCPLCGTKLKTPLMS